MTISLWLEDSPRIDAKYDNVLSCDDYNTLGETCPLQSGGKCCFVGPSYKEDLPLNKICDKSTGLALSDVIRFNLMTEEQWDSLQANKNTYAFKKWLESFNHYKLPELKRKEIERHILENRTGIYSLRYFRKITKPNDIGLTEKDAPSFRARVLTSFKEIYYGSLPINTFEKVALIPHRSDNDLYEEGDDDGWEVEILTRYSSFGTEFYESYSDFIDQLKDIFKLYLDKKILLEWSCWYSGGSYFEPEDCSWGIEEIRFIRELK